MTVWNILGQSVDLMSFEIWTVWHNHGQSRDEYIIIGARLGHIWAYLRQTWFYPKLSPLVRGVSRITNKWMRLGVPLEPDTRINKKEEFQGSGKRNRVNLTIRARFNFE